MNLLREKFTQREIALDLEKSFAGIRGLQGDGKRGCVFYNLRSSS